MISFLIWASHDAVILRPLPSASAIAVRAPTRLKPVEPRRQHLDGHVASACAGAGNCERLERTHVLEHVRFCRQRQVDAGRVRVPDDELVHIVQPLR